MQVFCTDEILILKGLRIVREALPQLAGLEGSIRDVEERSEESTDHVERLQYPTDQRGQSSCS
jgi:hypothetical protein